MFLVLWDGQSPTFPRIQSRSLVPDNKYPHLSCPTLKVCCADSPCVCVCVHIYNIVSQNLRYPDDVIRVVFSELGKLPREPQKMIYNCVYRL